MATKYKNISSKANQLLSKLLYNHTRCFRLVDALEILPSTRSDTIRKLVSDMTDRGLLMRLRSGVYYIIPFEEDPATYMPEWHGIASCLLAGHAHYIGYFSALQLHGLITQPSLKEQIVVAEQQKPSELQVRKVTFQFIYHNPTHFFGWTHKWVDPYQKVSCSDLEKTIIDCLFQPAYAGGIVEVAKALYASRNQIQFTRLLEYVDRFQSHAVLKRLGFLMELLQIESPVTEDLQKKKTTSYILLDPSLPKTGKHVSRWNIVQNMDSATITSAMNT